MPDIKSHLDALNALHPDARSRVESALKLAIDKELAAGTISTLKGVENASFDKQAHDRGPLFGKDSFDKQADPASHLQDMLELNKLDEAAFQTFTDRLRVMNLAKAGQIK